MLVHLLYVFDVVQSASYPSLIGDHGYRQAGPVQRGYRLNSALNELDSLDGTDMPIIDDDCAVPIKKNPLPSA